MKYMGSKRWMLKNGLGELLRRETQRCSSFVDLFTGSGAVAAFVARERKVCVAAYDLQSFSVNLAASIIERTKPLECEREWHLWKRRATSYLRERHLFRKSLERQPQGSGFTQAYVKEQRQLCADTEGLSITRAYGGHYFCRRQALNLDALRATVPCSGPAKSVAVAALLYAASECAASPGHTAQPFQPTRTAKRFLGEAWERDVVVRTELAFRQLGAQFALRTGRARVADANEVVNDLGRGDLVFIDPPYSGVHYSRFYHVLETISRGAVCEVSGRGRYPSEETRPWSRFSVKSESQIAIAELFEDIAEQKAKAIVTFPDKECSNGISGDYLRDISAEFFKDVFECIVVGRFSTLGGDGLHRDARQASRELVLVLRP